MIFLQKVIGVGQYELHILRALIFQTFRHIL